MVAASQNGFVVLSSSAGMNNDPVGAGAVKLAPGVRAGDVAVVLRYVAEQFDSRVERLVAGWCWGYANRPIRCATITSNHASGTAVDLNAPRHPLGKAGTFTRPQVEAIHTILAECGGVVRWGGDYTGRKDEQHFEVIGSAGEVAEVARQLTIAATPDTTTAPTPLPAVTPIVGVAPRPLPIVRAGEESGWVVLVQRAVGMRGKDVDGKFGARTRGAVCIVQGAAGLTVDGDVGPATWTRGLLARSGVLRLGDTGVGVEIVQNFMGWRPGAGLDGTFGPQTEVAVKAVQVWGGIDPDGVVGEGTRDVFGRA